MSLTANRFGLPSALLRALFIILLAATWSLPALRAQDGDATDADAAEIEEEETKPESNSLWSSQIGIRGNTDYFEATHNLLAPIFFDGKNLFLFDFQGGAYDQGVQSYSGGLAYRRYCEGLAAILGFNVFYDHKQTQYDNGFGGLGLGLEYKSRVVDMNFPYEFAQDGIEETDRMAYAAPFAIDNQIRQEGFRVYEGAHSGFWGEIGFPIHLLFNEAWQSKVGQLRVYGGGYHFEDAKYGEGFSGATGRLAWNPIQPFDRFTVDAAWYGDDRIAGNEWVFGFRWFVPLGNAKPILYSPNSGDSTGGGIGEFAGNDIRRRFGEDIYRMNMLQTSESDASFADASEGEEVVLDNVIFVNNGPATGNGIATGSAGGNGMADDPFDTIQDGTDAANAASAGAGGMAYNVYTQGGGPDYMEDVVPTESTYFIGSGKLIPAFGGFHFGEGPAPVLDGGFAANGIADFAVSGYMIIGGLSADSAGIAGSLNDGIAMLNVAAAYIACNIIDVDEDAIDFELTAGMTGDWTLFRNTLDSSDSDAVAVLLTGATAMLTAEHTTILAASDEGIDFSLIDSDLTGMFDRTTINGVTNDAIFIGTPGAANTSTIDFTFNRTTIDMEGTGDNGIDIEMDGAATTRTIAFNDLTIMDVDDDAIEAETLNDSILDFTLRDTTVTGTAGAGDDAVNTSSSGNSSLTLRAMNTVFEMIGGHGFNITNTGAAMNDTIIMTAMIDTVGGAGLNLDTDSTAGTTIDSKNYTAMNTGAEGIDIEVFGGSNAGNLFDFTDTLIDTTDTDATGGGDGISLTAHTDALAATGSGFVADFTRTTLRNIGLPNADGDGIFVASTDDGMSSSSVTVNLHESTVITDTGEDGIDTFVNGGSLLTFVSNGGLSINRTGSDGITGSAVEGGTLNFTVGGMNNRVSNAGILSDGIFFMADDNGFVTAAISNTTVDTTGFDGISLVTATAGIIDFTGLDIIIRNALFDGFNVDHGSAALVRLSLNNVDVFNPADLSTGNHAFSFDSSGGGLFQVVNSSTSSNDTFNVDNGGGFNSLDVPGGMVNTVGGFLLDGVLLGDPLMTTP